MHLHRGSFVRALAVAALPVMACGDDGGATTGSSTGGTATTTVTTGPGTATDTPTTTPETTSPTSTGTDGATGMTTNATSATTGDATSDTTGAVSATTGTEGETTTAGTTTGASTTTDTTGEPPCPADTVTCEGQTAKVCDGMGGFKSEEVCPEACVDGLGCVLCVPGEVSCEGDKVLVCNQQGDGKDLGATCDPLIGLACDPDAGACVGACAGLGLSYIGCEYYPTVLQNYDGYNQAPQYAFAVAVANASDKLAKVTVTRGATTITTVDVAPTSVQLITLPWVPELSSGLGPSTLVVDGAYRLRSTNPVTVYQYNPLTVTVTNDASLLLPTNTWTGNYLVAAWPTWIFGGQPYPGLYAVVAREDNTKVTVKPSATGKIVKAGGGIAADGTGVVMLGEGDVLSVYSSTNGDLTGTIIEADKPVQVMGGHKCSNVPLSVTACDHLEESMFPIETLAKEYVVVPSVQVPNDQADKGQMVRIIASEDDTTLVFNPDQPVGKLLAKAGDFVELKSTIAKFVVTADKKILVAQYMVGQDGGFGTSDPSMLLAVNPLQWRKSYLFHAPVNWQANYVDILSPKDASVAVDGVPVIGWQPVGATNYQVAHVKLTNQNGGNHSVTGSVGVGIGVYGVLNYGSYWYPGGLDLDVIPQ
jgi:hypothetical protein